MPYWRHAAIAGAAILVILVVKLFERVNRRYGIGAWLHEFAGDPWASIIMRLAFVGLVGLAAWGAQFLGFVVPDEIEQFIPSELSSIILALLAARRTQVRL